MTSPNGSPKQQGSEINVIKKTQYKDILQVQLEVPVPI